jgi:hypothetical protein
MIKRCGEAGHLLNFSYAAWEYLLIRPLRIFPSGPTGLGRLAVRPMPDGLRARPRVPVVPPALPWSRRWSLLGGLLHRLGGRDGWCGAARRGVYQIRQVTPGHQG